MGQSGLYHAPVDLSERHTLSESRRHVISERIKRAEASAIKILTQNRGLLVDVTEALLKDRELNRVQIQVLLQPGQPHCDSLSDEAWE